MIPTAEEFINLNQPELKSPFRLGVVASASNGLPVIIFDGEKTASGKLYARLDSYTPAVNDRVLLVKVSGSYIVLGKVVI